MDAQEVIFMITKNIEPKKTLQARNTFLNDLYHLITQYTGTFTLKNVLHPNFILPK